MSDQPGPSPYLPPQSSSAPPPPPGAPPQPPGAPGGGSHLPGPGQYGGPPPAYGAPPAPGMPPAYGMPPGYGGGVGGGYGGPVVQRRNGLAIAALVLGLLSIVGFITFILPALALGLGLAGASKAKKSGGAIGGGGMARAGWILGALGLAGFVTVIVLAATGVIDTDKKRVDDLDVGACYDLPLDDVNATVSTLREVDCDKPHDGQLMFEGELNPDRDREYVDDIDELTFEAGSKCIGAPYEEFVGRAYDPTLLDIYVLVPDETSWKVSKGSFSCFLVDPTGKQITGTSEGVGG